MAGVTHIGLCLGCDKSRVVDEDVPICMECLVGPRRGRKWALMMDRCRKDKRFARAVYDQIKTERGRRLFIQAFGLPPRFKEEGYADEE